MADKNFLYDTFNIYYNRGMEAKENGNQDLAKRNLLLAAETLLKMAKESKGEYQKSQMDRANRLIELANNLSIEVKPRANNVNKPNQAQREEEKEEGTQFEASKIPNISFKDVAGLDDVKEAVNKRIILPMRRPDIYKRFNKEIGGGVLLYGPPGTGKTMIAKAIANEAQADFYAVKCSDIVSKWFGESEKNIKELFETARKSERAIIFFDEFEALGAKRGDGSSDAISRMVPELLAQIQGFATSNQQLLLLAATNRPWDIDSAFLRPGRFNEMIYIGLPDYEARLYMIKRNFKDVPISKDLHFEDVARDTEGFNGADVKELCERMKDGPISRMIKDESLTDEVITNEDYANARAKVHSSVRKEDLAAFDKYRNKD